MSLGVVAWSLYTLKIQNPFYYGSCLRNIMVRHLSVCVDLLDSIILFYPAGYRCSNS